jgi:hypothetical protein
MWYAPTLWLFFFQVAIALPVAILGFWYGCLSRHERDYCTGKVFSSKLRVNELA